jgi:selenoprotein W-related protein
VGLAGEILKEFEHLVDDIRLVPSDGGRFEVTVNDQLIFSKLSAGRHAQPAEIIGAVTRMVEG